MPLLVDGCYLFLVIVCCLAKKGGSVDHFYGFKGLRIAGKGMSGLLNVLLATSGRLGESLTPAKGLCQWKMRVPAGHSKPLMKGYPGYNGGVMLGGSFCNYSGCPRYAFALTRRFEGGGLAGAGMGRLLRKGRALMGKVGAGSEGSCGTIMGVKRGKCVSFVCM